MTVPSPYRISHVSAVVKSLPGCGAKNPRDRVLSRGLLLYALFLELSRGFQ